MLRFIRRYMGPYAHWYAAGVLLLVATNWIAVTIPLFLAQGVDALGTEGGAEVVLWAAAKVIALGLLMIAVRSSSRLLFFTPGRLVEREVKRDVFASMMRHQPSFMHRWATGDLFSRVSSDVNMVRLLAGFGVLQLANVVLVLFFAGGQMIAINASLAGWLLPPILLALVVVQLFIQRLFLLLKQLQLQLADLSDHVLASYRGVASIQGYAAEDAFDERFEELNQAYRNTLVRRSEIRAFLSPTLRLAVAVDVFLLLYVGGPMVIAGELTIGELVALTTLVALVAGPLQGSSFLVNIWKQAQAALERVEEFLNTPPERPELPSPIQAPTTSPALEIRDLTFTWPDADEPALQGVSVSLAPGATLGVLGPTGAGKSTLLTLLARLYNPPAGTVFIDGTDIRDLDLDGWRAACTLVPQRPFLFSESVADNILLGRDDPALLTRVLRLTALQTDIEALPDGTATEVGESGVRLSGGQRQRTALARGVARDLHVLLLDDVLSAVDHATEAELIETLAEAGGERGITTVLVAHRVSALMHADHVLVLREGQVQDQGTPTELLKRDGFFRDTWQAQQAELAEEAS